jgi:hypothetical protein
VGVHRGWRLLSGRPGGVRDLLGASPVTATAYHMSAQDAAHDAAQRWLAESLVDEGFGSESPSATHDLHQLFNHLLEIRLRMTWRRVYVGSI